MLASLLTTLRQVDVRKHPCHVTPVHEAHRLPPSSHRARSPSREAEGPPKGRPAPAQNTALLAPDPTSQQWHLLCF